MNRPPFGNDEWYHCYSRGVEKRITFTSKADHERFLHLLYICNCDTALKLSDLKKTSYSDIFSLERGNELVHIGAYCLMPNHFHLLIKQESENGISTFMRKLGTAYTMYFNIKYERTGNLFVKPFRSKHVSTDKYIQKLVSYIHLNPLELFEPTWKDGSLSSEESAYNFLCNYKYSSLSDYYTEKARPERNILDEKSLIFLNPERKDINVLIGESTEYYQDFQAR